MFFFWRWQRPSPFRIGRVWHSVCLKMQVHVGRDPHCSQFIIPFDEFDNLHPVGWRPVPIPAGLARLLSRPCHASIPAALLSWTFVLLRSEEHTSELISH